MAAPRVWVALLSRGRLVPPRLACAVAFPAHPVRWAVGEEGLPRGGSPAVVTCQGPLPSVGLSLPWTLCPDTQGGAPQVDWVSRGAHRQHPRGLFQAGGREFYQVQQKKNRVCGQTWPPEAPFRKRPQGTSDHPSEAAPSVPEAVRAAAGRRDVGPACGPLYVQTALRKRGAGSFPVLLEGEASGRAAGRARESPTSAPCKFQHPPVSLRRLWSVRAGMLADSLGLDALPSRREFTPDPRRISSEAPPVASLSWAAVWSR